MNKGLLYIGVAFFFASYHAFMDKSVSTGMYTTNITDGNMATVVGIAMFLFGLICIITAFSSKNQKPKD